MSLLNDENERRKFNKTVDENPSFLHVLNYKFVKPYIGNKTVLDVGCWSGQIEKLAVDDAKKIVGIDPGKDAIDFAKNHIPKAHFIIGTIDNLPFKANIFDTALLLEVLEHIPKDTEILGLREINRVLKKGGFLLLSTPNKNLLSILFDPAFFLIGHRHYSEKELRIFLKKSNFEILDFSIRGGLIQALFNNISILAKYLFNVRIKEGKWLKENIAKGYQSGGFLTNCVIAKKIR